MLAKWRLNQVDYIASASLDCDVENNRVRIVWGANAEDDLDFLENMVRELLLFEKTRLQEPEEHPEQPLDARETEK